MEILEKDWKIFRRLHSIALERFSQRALEEVRRAADCDANYHDCYLKVYQMIRNLDKRMSVAFDDARRSKAFLLLANIVSERLLTEEELKQFSPELQARIQGLRSDGEPN